MGASASIPEPSDLPLEDRRHVFRNGGVTLAGVAELIRDGHVRQILIAAGAGISVSAGIPDFRSPGTGLYDNLQKYNLPQAESVFDLNYFRERPEPFCNLARELLPGKYKPTRTHYFCRLLEKKGLLLRMFTQNIDGLERLAGVSPELLVEAHGNFAGAHCIECRSRHSVRRWREAVDRDEVPKCGLTVEVPRPEAPPTEESFAALRAELAATKMEMEEAWKNFDTGKVMSVGVQEARLKRTIEEAEKARAEAIEKLAQWEAAPKAHVCEGLIKPDIVFFGESLPQRFNFLSERDGGRADLMIVMGTSLKVMPFAGLIGKVGPLCPRLLVNREPVGMFDQEDLPMFFGNIGFRCGREDNYRDVHEAKDCDAGVTELCDLIGWGPELVALQTRAASSEAAGSDGDSGDAFDRMVARLENQGPEVKFDSEVVQELVSRLEAAMADLDAQIGSPVASDAASPEASPEAAAGLSRAAFAKAAQRLRGSGQEPMLVVFEDLQDAEDRTGGMDHEEFIQLMQIAFESLNAAPFCALAARQLRVLRLPLEAPNAEVLHACSPQTLKELFGKVDGNGDGAITRDELAELLQDFDRGSWSDSSVDKASSTLSWATRCRTLRLWTGTAWCSWRSL